MSNYEGLPKTVPGRELPFSFKLKDKDGISYDGDFIVRVPSAREMGRIGVEMAKLNGGVPLDHLDAGTALLHNAVAYMRVVTIDAPKWFAESDCGLDLDNPQVILTVFEKAEKLISDWKAAIHGKSKKTKSEEESAS